MQNSSNPPKPRFNLLDEPWIPVAAQGELSLRDIFTTEKPGFLALDPRQTIAVMKLLLAISQAAATPANNSEWLAMSPQGLLEKAALYLEKLHDKFFLYGPEPFLQMPLQAAKTAQYGSLQPEIALGNNPRFMHMQCEQDLNDAERARLLVTQMSMCLGGKGYAGDKLISLSGEKRSSSAFPGPGMGFAGYLHSFLTGKTMLETLWLNLFTVDQIERMKVYPLGVGVPPWEKMPASENCAVARNLQQTYMGRLVPMARFCLLEEDGIKFTQGIAHLNYKDGMIDPSESSRAEKKEIKMLWTDPDKRPWRSLSARLAFLNAEGKKGSFECLQITEGLPRLIDSNMEEIGIWSGGLKVSSNTGEQYLSGNDDIVQSETSIKLSWLNQIWYLNLSQTMSRLDDFAKILYGCVMGYTRDVTRSSADNKNENKKDRNLSDALAKKAVSYFWDKSEELFPELLAACGNPADLKAVRRQYAFLVLNAYDLHCSAVTARQIASWAKHKPNLPEARLPEKEEVDLEEDSESEQLFL